MIDHVWSVLCGRSTTDRDSNNISLFEILEQINLLGPVPEPSAKAALPMQFEVVSLWSRANLGEPEESSGRIKMIAPNGTVTLTHEFPVALTENPRIRTQMRSIGFPLLGAGRYTFTVEIRRANDTWDTVARIPVQVESMAQAPVDPVASAN